MIEFRHASGENDYGSCVACSDEDEGAVCYDAELDPDEPAQCRWCGHTVEAVP